MRSKLQGHASMRAQLLLGIGGAVTALAAAGPALAFDSCSGTMAATRLAAPPAPLVIGVDVPDDSRRNVELADRFKQGLTSAGVKVSGTPTALLRISATVLNQGGVSGQNSRNFSGMSFAGEGLMGSPPDIGRRKPSGPPQPAVLQLRVDLTEPNSYKAAWIASVRCTMRGSDGGQLAQDMGALIGGSIGQAVQSKAF
jgi:hypothetical protein